MGDEDDDEEGTPTSYTFSPESKLDEDHLFLLQFTNNFISNVSRPRDFDHCTRWLEKLAGEPMYGVEAKRNRNMYLAMLLIAMQDNKVKGPFSTFPPPGALSHAGDAFGLTPEEEREGHQDMNMEAFDKELNMEDYKYKSVDNRTYVALSKLPNGFGCMGYVGLTIGGGEGLWLNREGEKVSLTDVMKNDVIPSITTRTPVQKQIDMITGFNWSNPPDLPDEAVPFDFLPGLPEPRSDTSLVEVKGAHRMTAKSKKALLEEYPPELVEILSRLMEKNKKHFDVMMRARHSKVVNQIYDAYKSELEKGLNEYKLARKEWQMVISVIQDFKELDKQIAKKEAESSGGDQGSSKSAKVLMNALQEAQKRKRKCLDDSGKLDSVKGEIHKIIHTRILEHKAELGVVDGQVQQLLDEIKRLRGDAKRKKMVIEGLVHELELYHEMD